MIEIDEIDRKLLHLLQNDGRMPQNELAKAVGLAVSSVNDRIRKLTEKGVIEGIFTHVSAEALGLDLKAMVFVAWGEEGTEEVFLAYIQSLPNVLECHHVTGVWNYLMKVYVHNTKGLESFLSALKKNVRQIQRTETIIVLSSPKETCLHGTGHLQF